MTEGWNPFQYFASVNNAVKNIFVQDTFSVTEIRFWDRIPENGNCRLKGYGIITCCQIPFQKDVPLYITPNSGAGRCHICLLLRGGGHFH